MPKTRLAIAFLALTSLIAIAAVSLSTSVSAVGTSINTFDGSCGATATATPRQSDSSNECGSKPPSQDPFGCANCNWSQITRYWKITWGDGSHTDIDATSHGDCYWASQFSSELTKCQPDFQTPTFTYETDSHNYTTTTFTEVVVSSVHDGSSCRTDIGHSQTLTTAETCDALYRVAGTCGGSSSGGCNTGFTDNGGGYCGRSQAFQNRCVGVGYDVDSCSCPDGTSTSPIIIDVNHSGFSLTDAAGGVVFNILNDGVPLQISWTSSSSSNALLVLDRNGNGRIDNGTELFGNITPQPVSSDENGFLALAEYDKPRHGGNGSGRIDQGDTVFARLRLWQDANHNGISEPNELHTLPQLGVRAIDLNFKESRRTDENGNKFRYRAKIYDEDGTHTGRWAWDAFLKVQ